MISNSGKVKISFNAVVETEVKCERETILTQDDIQEVLFIGDLEKETETFEIDQVDEIISQQLNETILGLVPDELKKNCVSMTFTDIKITILD